VLAEKVVSLGCDAKSKLSNREAALAAAARDWLRLASATEGDLEMREVEES
jgi:hypothetical protein